VQAVEQLYALPFNDLLYRAQTVHREHFDPNSVQLSTLLSIKTGGCPEDCGYCPQSVRYATGVQNESLMSLQEVVTAARRARESGATRFCMGAAWRGPKDRDLQQVTEMVKAVRALGMETCATLGMLKPGQADELKAAGLDYYNHNIDTAPEFYGEIITTRSQSDRFDTLQQVRDAGINVCCGGIVGMGETRRARAALIAELASLDPYPESVPINNLVQVEGTPLHGTEPLDPFEFVRTVACARITMPKAVVRLSAGRQEMPDAIQALCFLAGANSIFYGEKLLTTGNPEAAKDEALFARLGLRRMDPRDV
jgi:biotin synthase